MKDIVLTKESLVGKYILAGNTSDGYYFGDIYDNKESAESRFEEISSAFEACEGSDCVTGSVEIIRVPENATLLSKRDFDKDEMADKYEDSDFMEIPKSFGYAEDYILIFPMNVCVLSYRDLEGHFLDSL